MATGSLFVEKQRMHFARLGNSPRLRQVLSCLLDASGRRVSAGDIDDACRAIFKQRHMAIHSDIAELRCNGIEIQRATRNESGIYEYWIAPEHIEAARIAQLKAITEAINHGGGASCVS